MDHALGPLRTKAPVFLFFTSFKKIAIFSHRCDFSRQAFTLSSNFLTHMKNKSLLLLSALAMMSILHAAAEPKRMVVCTITEGFRHSSIPESERALQAIDDASPDLEIVQWLRQPEIEVPVAPRPPKEPADKASQDKYQSAMQAWDRDVKPEAERKKRELHEAVKKSLLSLSPQALRDNRIDAVIFSNTTGHATPHNNQKFYIAEIRLVRPVCRSLFCVPQSWYRMCKGLGLPGLQGGR